MTIAHQLSSLLAADSHSQSSDIHVCSYCGKCYLPNGQFVERPFILINCSHGCCRVCFPQKLKAARQTAKEMSKCS
jgi:hypothetical protein